MVFRALTPNGPPTITALDSPQAGTVEAEWETIDGATTYRLSASLDRTMTDAVSKVFTAPEGMLTGLHGGQRYYITVEPVGGTGDMRLGPRPITVRRAAPEDVTVRAIGAAAEVRWKVADDVPEYLVSIAEDETMSRVSELKTSSSPELMTNLEPGLRYWVTVAPSDDRLAASAPVSVEIPVSSPLKVGTFNLYGIDNDRNLARGAQPWRVRRPVVVDQITSADLDVVGLQEANQSAIYSTRMAVGPNQMSDLRAGLRAKNPAWQLVNDVPYNCARGWSSSHCVKRDRGASWGTRIMYRSDRLDVIRSGTVRYRMQNGRIDRYMAWAVFRHKQSGAEIFFVTTHLQPGHSSSAIKARRAQWKQLIEEIQNRSEGRSVVVTGDFNTSRNQQPGEMFEAMSKAGIPEITGTRARQNPPTENRARQTVHGDLSSYHGFKRNLRAGGSCYCGSKTRMGNSIDFIFASKTLKVVRWELVANIDSAYRLIGTMPSDHHLVTSILEIPSE